MYQNPKFHHRTHIKKLLTTLTLVSQPYLTSTNAQTFSNSPLTRTFCGPHSQPFPFPLKIS